MDSWDQRFTYTQSLYTIAHNSTPSSSKTAVELYQKKCQEFVAKINELMEELKLARWPVAEVEKRWKSIEPLMQEADRISLQTSIPMQPPSKSKIEGKTIESFQTLSSYQSIQATSNANASNVPSRSHLDKQYEMMAAQDASLGSLNDTVRRIKDLGRALSEESANQNQIISEISSQVDEMDEKTSKSTEKAKKL